VVWHGEVPDPSEFTHAARIFAIVFSFAASGVAVTLSPVPVPVPFNVAEVTAVPDATFTRLLAVANAFVSPTLFVLDAPKLSVLELPNVGVKNCPSAIAAAAVVTSLIVMNVPEVRFPQAPSGATSMIALLFDPTPGSPPEAVM
jgi:hypothetical protein